MQEVPYVIIDDEYVILESQLPHFILTNPYLLLRVAAAGRKNGGDLFGVHDHL